VDCQTKKGSVSLLDALVRASMVEVGDILPDDAEEMAVVAEKHMLHCLPLLIVVDCSNG
jgi:hypothetical protein